MVYADFTYYKGTFGGAAITEEVEFTRLAAKASGYIDYLTWFRAKYYAETDAVKMACCALAEQYKTMEALSESSAAALQADTAGMQSQTVGSYSVTYRNAADVARAGAETVSEMKKELYSIAQQYLLPTGLLYRGRGCGRCTLPTL